MNLVLTDQARIPDLLVAAARQAQERDLLDRVRTALARELDLPTIFRTVVEAIAETFGYTQVSLYLREDHQLMLQHQVGYDQVLARIPVTQGVIGRVACTGEPTLLEDVRTEPAFLGAMEGIVSEVCVPVRDENRVAGVLNVESTGGVRLGEADLELMLALSEHVSIAVGRARLHTEIRASEARFRSLVQNALDIITILEANGTICYESPAVERVLGYAQDELLGIDAFALVHPDDVVRVRGLFQEALRKPGVNVPAEFRFQHKDGSWRWLEVIGTNLLDDPAVGGVVVNSRDVTERKRVEWERAELLAREEAARAEAEAGRERFEFLARAGRVLASSLDYEATLSKVARLVVPAFADSCVIDLVDNGSSIYRVATASVDPAKENVLRELERYAPDPNRPPFALQAVQSGQPVLVAEVPNALPMSRARDAEHLTMLRLLATRSAMCVPLIGREGAIGAISFLSSESSRRYGRSDLALAELICRGAALAIENARLYRNQVEAASRIEQLATELGLVLRQIADGVMITDPTGRIVFVNEAARCLIGADALNVPVEQFSETYGALTMEGAPCRPDDLPHARAIGTGEAVVNAKLRFRQPNRTDIIVEGSAAPVVAADSSRLGAVLTLHDVTAHHELEHQKDEFFANISHDLRTPLTAIKAAVGVVLANELPNTPEPLHRMLLHIDGATDRMTGLVDNLLELTRLQAGRVQLSPERCDLRALVLRSARAIEPLAQTRGQRVEVNVPATPLLALSDIERLERALLNLLSNAHKYGRDGGIIRLGLERRPGEAVLAVADDGPGIPAADQERIFERFFRADTEETRDHVGSGLGLAIVRATVELHRGRIWVESSEGRGTTFWISLPTRWPDSAQEGEDIR